MNAFERTKYIKEKLIESSINWQIHNLGGRLEYISHETTDQVNRKYRRFKQHNWQAVLSIHIMKNTQSSKLE